MARLKINNDYYDIGEITLTAYGVPFDTFIVRRTIADQSVKIPYSIATPFGTLHRPNDVALDAVIYLAGGDTYNVTASPTSWGADAVSIALVQRYSAGIEKCLGANLTDWAEESVVDPNNTIVNGYPFVKIMDLLRWLSRRTSANIAIDTTIEDYYNNTSVVANGELGDDGEQWDGVSAYRVRRNLPNVSVIDFLTMLCKAVGGYVEVTQDSIILRQRESPTFVDYSDQLSTLESLGKGALPAKSNYIRYKDGWTAPQYTLRATRRDLPTAKDFVLIDINALATSYRYKDLSTNKPYQGTLLIPRPDIRNNFVWSYFSLMLEGWQTAKLSIMGVTKVSNYFSLGGDYYQTISYTSAHGKCSVQAYRITGEQVARAEIVGKDSGDVISIGQGDYSENIASKQEIYWGVIDYSDTAITYDLIARYWILHQYRLAISARKRPTSFETMTRNSVAPTTVDLINKNNVVSYVRDGADFVEGTLNATIYYNGATTRVTSYNFNVAGVFVSADMLRNWADEVGAVVFWVRLNPNTQQYPRTNGYPYRGSIYFNDNLGNSLLDYECSGSTTVRDQRGEYHYIPANGTTIANLLRLDCAQNFEPTPNDEQGSFPLNFTLRFYI